MSTSEAAASLRASLEELRALHNAGAGGHELARRRADLIDLALIAQYRQAEQRALAEGRLRDAGLAVIAVGGFGRRDLAPYSDVDLMLLYEEGEKERVPEVAEALFYPLWDAGLELGHGARTVEECLSVAADVEAETALLQSRFLVGDQQLFGRLLDRLHEQVTADGGRAFVDRLRTGRAARQEEYGACASLLEPHLKEGQGGLRDVHELLWALAGLHRGTGVQALQETGWLDEQAVAQLEAAVEVLLRTRTSLHYLARRRVDRLFRHYQEEFPPGTAGPEGAVPPFPPLERLFEAAHTVSFLTADAWEALMHEVGLSDRRAPLRLPPYLPSDPRRRRIFLTELLREGADGLPRLERLSHEGVLSAWLPGWEAIRMLAAEAEHHLYTVDAHSLRCVATAVELATTGGPDPVGAGLAAELALSPEWEAFLLACLLHDVGKGSPDADHAEAGAAAAALAARELGQPEETQEEIAFLVREHLLLADTATRRDLDDSTLLTRLAARIGSRRRLEMLYVLTVADSVATGPAFWTPWTAALMHELFFKLEVLFDGDETSAVLGDATGTGSLRAPQPIEDHSASAGEGEARLLHRSLVQGGPGGVVSVEVREGALEGVQELRLSSAVYRGRLTRICGLLTVHGINILAAQLQPADRRQLVRTFSVADYFGQELGPERWEAFAADLGRALVGRLGLEHRVAERRARYRRPRAGSSAPPRVVLDNTASDSLTVIEVEAPDRIGLLYQIARTLDDLLLEVRVAKVSTLSERVIDVFYVADAFGRKVADDDHLREIEQAVLFALAEGE